MVTDKYYRDFEITGSDIEFYIYHAGITKISQDSIDDLREALNRKFEGYQVAINLLQDFINATRDQYKKRDDFRTSAIYGYTSFKSTVKAGIRDALKRYCGEEISKCPILVEDYLLYNGTIDRPTYSHQMIFHIVQNDFQFKFLERGEDGKDHLIRGENKSQSLIMYLRSLKDVDEINQKAKEIHPTIQISGTEYDFVSADRMKELNTVYVTLKPIE